jgi:hypothetical protein
MNRGLFSFVVPASLIASLILLTGCTIVVTPFQPDADIVSAQAPSGNPTPVASGSLAPGAAIFYQVNVSSSVAGASDVIYYEVDVGDNETQDLANTVALRLYSSGGSVLASSVSHEGFTSGSAAEANLTGLSTEEGVIFDRQAIGFNWQCFGPCIIGSSTTSTRYVRLENVSSTSRAYALYAYGQEFSDTGEPANNSTGSAPTLDPAGDGGAIEILGDVDYFYVEQPGFLNFASGAAPELDLVAEVLSSGGALQSRMTPGGGDNVFVGELVRVYSRGGWAGSPEAAGYDLFYE